MVTLIISLAAFGCASVSTPQLTPAERRADIEYMAQWARENSPMVGLVEKNGVSEYENLLPVYLEYAEQADSDEAFLRVAQAYGDVICPLGHHYLVGESMIKWVAAGVRFGFLDLGIDPSSTDEARSWSRLSRRTPLCAHPPFSIVRTGDDYLTDREWESDSGIIPKGAQIIRVNGMSCASYLDYLEKETFLRYRADKDEVRQKLLVVNEGEAFKGWQIDFLLPDNSTMHAFVPKLPFCPGYRLWSQEPEENCTAIELTDDTGYIRIKNMHSGMLSYVLPGLHNRDRKIIRQFLNDANGKYRKLIIDVRNNSGGSPAYAYRNLIQPFLDEPVTYTQVAGVKRAYEDQLTPSELKTLRIWSNEKAHVIRTEEVPVPEEFDKRDWVFYRITRKVEPDNRYNFTGSLYVLTDKGTFSAADDFANAVKRIGYARLVGQNTGGGSAAYLLPPALKLPNSSMIFRVETEIVINPDASINERVGTPPDVRLPLADPPGSISREDLLRDEWIKYIIHTP